MDPVTWTMLGLGAASAGLTAAGTAAKVRGDKQQTEAEVASANYNAALAAQRAASERESSAAESQDYLRQNLFGLESGIAQQGASGVTPEGSPLMVNSATVREIALGAERIRHGGQKRAVELESEALLDKSRAEFARRAGKIRVAGDILGGASTILGNAALFGRYR